MPSVSWTDAYRLALHLLPAALRRKHGPAMETLFAREVRAARARGWRHQTLIATAGLWDVVRRGVYEQVRPLVRPLVRSLVRPLHGAAASERGDRRSHDARGTNAHGPRGGPHAGPHVPLPTTRQLLRRHALTFAAALVALTASLLALYARKQAPALSARGAPAGTIAEALLLAVPFTVALTIPMAVFVAVLYEFARLRTDGTLAAARRQRGGVRRLVGPVLTAAVAVAALTLGSNTVLLPRANERLAALLAGRVASTTSAARSDREMTVGELHAAARRAREKARAETRANATPQALAVAAVYEVEIQKKYALAAACVVLALTGMAISLRVPHGDHKGRGGAGLMTGVIGASGAVFGAYYVLIMTGEDLAEQLVVSPVVGMWAANAVLLGVALLVLWRRRAAVGPVGDPTVPLRG